MENKNRNYSNDLLEILIICKRMIENNLSSLHKKNLLEILIILTIYSNELTSRIYNSQLTI
jgi:hypothetical protein